MMNQIKDFYRFIAYLIISLFIVSCTAGPFAQPVPTSTLVLKPMIQQTEAVREGIPTYARPGPYTVGITALPIGNGDAIADAFFIWYPVQADGKPNKDGGPFPLVIYASGWATPAVEGYAYLLKQLASYGFVAVSWTPRRESSNAEENDWYAPLGYRPLDFKNIVGYVESMNARGGPLQGMIDIKRIAIAGHSMGGGTALELSGAQLDFRWCTAHPDLVAKDEENTCPQYVGFQKETANLRGLGEIPEGKWPSISDPRIVAVVVMAPMGKLWGAEYDSLASVKVPAMVMTGDQDTVLLPELSAYPVYEHLGSQEKYLVVFEQKDHLLFWGPDYTTGTAEDLDRIKHITTAFFLAEVKNDKEAAKALSAANRKFSGIRFEATTK